MRNIRDAIVACRVLKTEEYLAVCDKVPSCGCDWWLAGDGTSAEYVSAGGEIGVGDAESEKGFRPALRYKSGVMGVSTGFDLCGYTWTVIEDGIALCDRVVDCVPYCVGGDCGTYVHTDLYKFSQGWYEENFMYGYTRKDLKESMGSQERERDAFVTVLSNGELNKLTYSESKQRMDAVAEKLQENGVEKGSVIAIMTPVGKVAGVLCRMCWLYDYVAMPIDMSLPVDERRNLIEYVKPAVVLLGVGCEDVFTGVSVFGIDENVCVQSVCIADDRLETELFDYDEIAGIICTSGTTGVLRPVLITNKSLMSGLRKTQECLELKLGTRFFAPLPLSHVTGFDACYFATVLNITLIYLEEFSSTALMTGFAKCEPEYILLIPKVYEIIKVQAEQMISELPAVLRWLYKRESARQIRERKCGNIPEFDGVLIKRIREKIFGRNVISLIAGAAGYKATTAEFYLGLHVNFLNIYGMTECGFPIAGTKLRNAWPVSGYDKLDSISGIDVRLNAEDGEIQVRTPMIMGGYLRDAERTAAVYTKDGWFKTGDVGQIDECGCLEIIGRLKDTIVLMNGNKVSPEAVENFYADKISDLQIAVCGVKGRDHEEIWMFVEGKGHNAAQIAQVRTAIIEKSISYGGLYKLQRVEVIPEIPKTSVGKSKRYRLQEIAFGIIERGNTQELGTWESGVDKSIYGRLEDILNGITGAGVEYSADQTLKDDIGLDSLSMMTLCVEIENAFGVRVDDKLRDDMTVGELEGICSGGESVSTELVDPQEYPKVGLRFENTMSKMLRRYMERNYDFTVIGLKHLEYGKNYVFCSNHTSFMDPLSIKVGLSVERREKCCTLAADYLSTRDSKKVQFGLRMMHYIPMSRAGNYLPAFKRASELYKAGNDIVIFPEGTRSKDGTLLSFLDGGSMLAKENGAEIIPVCLCGVAEMFPVDVEKFVPAGKVLVIFGKPIKTDGEISEITQEVRSSIVDMRRRANAKFGQRWKEYR